MAYSDYGGYAYRNGERVVERSDATITADGDVFGTPGLWPGFAKSMIQGAKDWPSGHAVLGDGPIYVVLYKQSGLMVYRAFEKLTLVDFLECDDPEARGSWTDEEGVTHYYIDTDYFDDEKMCVLNVDGWRIEAWWEWTNNHYQYVCVTQPNGVIWAGWSGYGVGAGLEDAGYGYSTGTCENRVKELFPRAFDAALRGGGAAVSDKCRQAAYRARQTQEG